jgi:hypothetical protein
MGGEQGEWGKGGGPGRLTEQGPLNRASGYKSYNPQDRPGSWNLLLVGARGHLPGQAPVGEISGSQQDCFVYIGER